MLHPRSCAKTPVGLWSPLDERRGSRQLGLLLFFLSVTAAAGIAAWLRLRSGSVWPAVLFHASHNVFLQAFFDPLTVTTGRAGYFATEGGLGMVIAYCLILAALLRLGGVPARDGIGNNSRAGDGSDCTLPEAAIT